MNTPRTKRPILRYAAAALAMAAALGASACSPHSQSAPGGGVAGAQVGDLTPEQIKEAGEITIGIISYKAPYGYIDAD